MYYIFYRTVDKPMLWCMNSFDDETKALEYYADIMRNHGVDNTLFLQDLPESGRISGTLHLDWPDADCKAKSFG